MGMVLLGWAGNYLYYESVKKLIEEFQNLMRIREV